jgi:subtilisin family serine protease
MEQSDRELRQQVEQIADNSSQTFVDVIVGFGDSEKPNSNELSVLTESLNNRRNASSARDVLPQRSAVTAAAGNNLSKAAQLSSSASLEKAMTAQRERVKISKDLLLESDLVKSSMAQFHEFQNAGDPEKIGDTPRLFWSANAIRIHLKRDSLAQIVRNHANISHVSPNRRMRKPSLNVPARLPDPLDENHFTTWGVEASGALGVWGATGRRGAGIKIGLLDTGVDASHPDLMGKVANWAEFDASGNAVVGSTPHDTDQHGTHCAGILVGGNTSGRWIGLAPEAEIASALVLGGDHATDAQILAGLEWCIETGVDVVSMSLGGLTLGIEPPATYTRAALTAVQHGIFIVAAVGNDGSETSTSPGNDVLIMSVGAIDHLGRVAAFSGGRTEAIEESLIFPKAALPMVYSKPDLSAPGVAIYSSVPGMEWAIFSGTSMATPHVSAAVALLLSATNIQQSVQGLQRIVLIEKLLTGSANEAGEVGQNHRYGFGTLNILRAVGNAKEAGLVKA